MPPPTLESRCRTQPQPLSRASSSSGATARCGRSGVEVPAPSGLPGTSRTGSTSLSRSSLGRARRHPGPSGRRRPPPACATPSCQRAYGFGRDSQHVYIAYEYVPGRTFREALRSGELDDDSTIEACAQILEALAHAHARGIVHRDVKPSNVLLAEGRDVSVRVLDFGLAQIQQAETLTAQGDVPGTLAYIAPERLAGALTTEAADVWAVGLMLWEALAGRHPFWRSSFLETARAIERRRAATGDCAAGSAEAASRRRQPRPRSRSGPATECSSPRRDGAARRPQAACPQGRGSDPGRSGRVAAARPAPSWRQPWPAGVPGRSRSSLPAGRSVSQRWPPAPPS